MRFEKVFKQIISMILTGCVIFASPAIALPQSTTSSTSAAQTPSRPPKNLLPPGGGPWPATSG